MNKLTINFIGAGNLGKTIAKLITLAEAGMIKGVCNSTFESSQRAVNFIGHGLACASITDLPKADIIFITVPDDKIVSICQLVAELKDSPKFVIHCSGLLSSEILAVMRTKGSQVASVHPMHSFADPDGSVKKFVGTCCAVEGDPEAEAVVKNIFSKIGANNIKIEKQKKAIYHAAGVICSNYLITIADNAMMCFQDAGIGNEEAKDIVLNMMQGTLNNLMTIRSLEKALTGPIKRGDIQTVKAHIISFHDKLRKKLYLALGESTLKLTNHDAVVKKKIENALQEKD